MKNRDKVQLILASAAKFEALSTIDALVKLGVSFTYLEIGIGPINGSMMSARFIDLVRDRDVIFIGSCGVSRDFFRPELVAISRVMWAPSDVRRGQGYLVSGVEPEIEMSIKPEFARGLLYRPAVGSASISLVQEAPDQFTMENLELYSVAKCWQFAAKSITAILGTTNQIGPGAHTDWKKNFPVVCDLTTRHISEIFKN